MPSESQAPTNDAWHGSLPPELWEQIAQFASGSSQTSYYSLLLTCRWFYQTTRYPCLSLVPVRIAARKLSAFSDLVNAQPDIAHRVRYLWITGDPKRVAQALASCKNLVALACSGHALIELPPVWGTEQMRHDVLRELTLFDGWERWSGLQPANPTTGPKSSISHQITHLRVHGSLIQGFPTQNFSSLTHFSSSTSPIDDISFPQDMEILNSLPNLKRIVICTYNWKDRPPNQQTRDLVEGADERLRIVYFGGGEHGEFEIWSRRTSEGLSSLWTMEKPLRWLT
jgi:hypothetical protein